MHGLARGPATRPGAHSWRRARLTRGSAACAGPAGERSSGSTVAHAAREVSTAEAETRGWEHFPRRDPADLPPDRAATGMPDLSRLPPANAAALRTQIEMGYPLPAEPELRDVENEVLSPYGGHEIVRRPTCPPSTVQPMTWRGWDKTRRSPSDRFCRLEERGCSHRGPAGRRLRSGRARPSFRCPWRRRPDTHLDFAANSSVGPNLHRAPVPTNEGPARSSPWELGTGRHSRVSVGVSLREPLGPG